MTSGATSPNSISSGNVVLDYQGGTDPGGIRVYRKRYLILGLFVLYSMSNAFQWIEYAIITNIVMDYYGVSAIAVNWTSIIFMVTYIPLVFPASWILDWRGLRFSVLVGAAGTCLGSWIKVGGLSPNRFDVAMVGQTITAMSQVFILGVPPHLAAVWFGSDEVSRACGVGVFGNQLGIALGFVIPPQLVPNSGDKDEVGRGLSILFYGVAALTTLLLIAIAFVFEDKPKLPPSRAQAFQKEGDSGSYLKSIKNLMANSHYLLLLVTYGMNVGVFYAVSTLLNQIILAYFPGKEQEAGWMGLTIVIAGMLGSVVCSTVLDKTHKFKETVSVIYILTLVSMVAYTGALHLKLIWVMFLISALLGFFMTGYLPLGFEFAAELTYPEPEGTSSGLLNASAQVFGIAATLCSSYLLENLGDLEANLSLIVLLAVGTVLTLLIKSDLKRTNASRDPDEIVKLPSV